MATQPRSEKVVLAELEALARTPGYAHVVAHLCNRDNLVIYREQIKPDDMAKLYGHDRLIRTELDTLIGLMVKGPLDLTEPSPSELLKMAERTDVLMQELHDALNVPMMERMKALVRAMRSGGAPTPDSDEMWQGETMREPIFYAAESAYSFQYRDLAVEKYSADDAWLLANKGFNITQAKNVAHALCQLMDESGAALFARHKSEGRLPSTWLPCYEHTVGEVAFRSRLPEPVAQAVLDAFTLRGQNETFKALGDFNAVSAFPVIATDRSTVLMFQHYNILEALYESPYFWMGANNPEAAKHRGDFVENFAKRRLTRVFGPEHVHRGVQVVRHRKEGSGEIDVLVVFGDRLIIVQAKSKKLTLEARKGNDGRLRKDFKEAIQDSYDQGLDCANKILSGFRLEDAEGREIALPYPPKEIYLVSLVSDHYPALAFQAREFLKYQTTEVIKPPFVMDVFLLDALTEMLATPLRLMSYVSRRVNVTERVVLSHEFNALGYHLKRNLWLEDEVSMAALDDTLSVDLDTAMTVRREGIPGQATPGGILTRMNGTLYERLIQQIEGRADPAALAIGFELLTLSEQACFDLHNGISRLTQLTRADGKVHDLSLPRPEGGLCIHCNVADTAAAKTMLGNHCEMRKYREKAPRWYGISLDTDANLQFGVALSFPWVQSDEMDAATRHMPEPQPVETVLGPRRRPVKAKIGRNDPCHCGSGIKYKKCHGR